MAAPTAMRGDAPVAGPRCWHDFERTLVVKQNAPELLRAQLQKPSWTGETIVFSGVTVCYQPLEASYQLTRRCLQVCAEFRQPVGIITKGALVERDVDVLAQLAKHDAVTVFVSVPLADESDARAIEPFAGSPARRLRALATLSAAGVRTGVSVSPLTPGLNDHQVPAILAAARAAGAQHAFHVLLRLPAEVEQVFVERLRAAFPLRADKVLSLLTAMRAGRTNDPRFHSRMRGSGPRWQLMAICSPARRSGSASRRRRGRWRRRRSSGRTGSNRCSGAKVVRECAMRALGCAPAMKVRLLTVSHKQPAWVHEGCAEYEKRLPREWGFQLIEVKPDARTSGAPTEKVQTAEAQKLRAALGKNMRVVALDERGEAWSTRAFADKLQRWQQDGRDVAFIVGGADGLEPAFRDAADVRLALSAMTMPHGLVRVVLVEQLYRAASLLAGHPYHK